VDHPIGEFKGITRVEGDIDSAFAILCDTRRMAEGDHYIRHAEVLSVVDSSEFYACQIVETPIIMRDRDIVMRVHTHKTGSGRFMVSESEPDHIPVKPNLVRQQQLKVFVSLEQLDNRTIELIYKGSVGAVGNDLLVNFTNKAIVNPTFDRLKSMRRQLSAPKTVLQGK